MKPDTKLNKIQTAMRQQSAPGLTTQSSNSQLRYGVFGATPPPSDARQAINPKTPPTGYGAANIHHNQRMTNITRVHRTVSVDRLPTHHHKWTDGFNAAIHSPLLRTLSPQISPYKRKRSFTPMSTESPSSKLEGILSFKYCPGLFPLFTDRSRG